MIIPKTTSSRRLTSLKLRAWVVSSAFPDGIVFVNGIPVVVLEFKSAVKENTTIMDAYKQLTVRYRRDIPELLKYNAFVVISDGANNKYGSLSVPMTISMRGRKVELMIRAGRNQLPCHHDKGLFRKDRLLAVIKDFIYFPDSSDKELKIVCRYPQFLPLPSCLRISSGICVLTVMERVAPISARTGCGKSYTMLFLTRMLMKSKLFHSRPF